MYRTFREMRRDRGLTLKELAQILDIGVPHLSKIERSKERPSWDLLRFMAEELGFDPVKYGVVLGLPEAMWLRILQLLDELAVWENGVGRALYGDAWPGDLASGPSDLLPLIKPIAGIHCTGFNADDCPICGASCRCGVEPDRRGVEPNEDCVLHCAETLHDGGWS